MSDKVIQLESSVPVEYVGREGLLQDNENSHDDSWLHSDMNDKFRHDVNKKYRTFNREKDVDLVIKGIDTSVSAGRRLNTSKLVKRPTQVKGKDGKIYTRMQWVDPTKDMPGSEQHSSQQEIESSKPNKSSMDIDFWNGQNDDIDNINLEATKKKVYDVTSQKGFIDKKLDGMSKEEKQVLIDKYNLTWKKNDHASIDWKNAVMALKSYMYDNPHLLDAGHLPKEGKGEETLDGTDKVNDYCNKMGREQLYELMNKYKIYDGQDPRNNPEWASKTEGGDGTAPIRHMKNMMALKKYLKENPHLMGSTERPQPTKKKATEPKPQPTPAQKGGNDINTILKGMTDTEKYDLMRRIGIADTDPRQDPRYDKITGDSTGAIRHMKNMMELKKHLSLHPEDLANKLGEEGVKKEKAKAERKQKEEEKKQEQTANVSEHLAKLSKDSKLFLIKKFKDDPILRDRVRHQDPNIDYMRSMMALKKVLENDPDKLDEVKEMADYEDLRNTKISVKMLEKILRDICKITSTQIDYATVVEKNKEWKFGISSFAIIQDNDDGVPVLSVVDTGDDGAGWEEHEFPMTQIRDFINKAKSDKAKAKEEAGKLVQRNEIPLHKKSIQNIEEELTKNFSQYTDEVGEVMKPILAHYWDSQNHKNNINDLAKVSNMSPGTMKKLFEKLGISVDVAGYFATNTDEWLSIACRDLIDSTKQKNAEDYLFINRQTGEVSSYPLKESAKQWSAKERYQARAELVHNRLSVPEGSHADSQAVLSRFTTDGTLYVPFDLMADMLANGIKFRFKDANDGGCHYNKKDNEVVMGGAYVRDIGSITEDTTAYDYKPKGTHPYVDAVSHEFAHAVDGYFSAGSIGYLNWNSPQAQKYVGEQHKNCVRESYYQKVDKSNPHREVIKVTFNGQESFYHKDEWMSTYEARVYGTKSSDYYEDSWGSLFDQKSKGADRPINSSVGVEHWSENVSRYAMAFGMYQKYLKENPDKKGTSMDDWAKSMRTEYESQGYGDDWASETSPAKSYRDGEKAKGTFGNRDDRPIQSYGYLFDRMKESNPRVWEGINHVFNRPDFLDDKSTPKPTERANEGDFTRKSLYIRR